MPQGHWIAVGLCIAGFLFAGCVFIPCLGIQNDEALFGNGIYVPEVIDFTADILGARIPVMLMSYVGALKSWLYTPIFAFWAPSVYSIRLPVLFAGAAAILLFFGVATRAHSRQAAAIGCILLSTDAVFLLTVCFDWGPVALQHVLLLAGLALLIRFSDKKSDAALAAGFFCFGLALWDKAVFAWFFAGLAAAAFAAFPRRVRESFGAKRIVIAALALSAGALPLLVVNTIRPLVTVRANAELSLRDFRYKARMLKDSMDGSALFGYMVRNSSEAPRAPRTRLERLSVSLARWCGDPRRSLMPWAFAAGLAVIPWVWRSRGRASLVFSLVFLSVSWAVMALTGGGGSAHHTVMLWPFPHFLVSVALVEGLRGLRASGKALLAMAVLLLAGANLLVLNQYQAQAVVHGGGTAWSDAIYGLSEKLERTHARSIFVMDWGIFNSVSLLQQGRLPLRIGSDPVLRPDRTPDEGRMVREMISTPEAVFVAHTPANEFFPGVNARLTALARQHGYGRELLATISDRNGRPVFEITRFRLMWGSLTSCAPVSNRRWRRVENPPPAGSLPH